MNKKQDEIITATFTIPSAVNQKLNERVIIDGYGMRGKSRWIEEALMDLFIYPNYEEFVSISDDTISTKNHISVRLPRSLLLKMDNAVFAIRKIYPEIEGIKGKIIHTAIMQRLIRLIRPET